MSTTVLAEIDAQYRELREGCAVVPRAGLRLLRVSGEEAGDYLQSQLTNDIGQLRPGGGIYAALLSRKARVLADMRVLWLAADEFWLMLEEAAFEAASGHLEMYKIGRRVEIGPLEPARGVLTLIGPALEDRIGLVPGPAHQHRPATVAGHDCLTVSAPIGDLPALDLVIESDSQAALLEALAELDVPAATEQAVEILRIEAGIPRFGHEIGPEVMPAEAGIVARAISFEKGCYIGQEPVARLHYRGRPNRLLRRLALGEPAAPGTPIASPDRELGVLTSSCISPARGPLGLAVLRREAEPGATVRVGETGTAVVEAVEEDS